MCQGPVFGCWGVFFLKSIIYQLRNIYTCKMYIEKLFQSKVCIMWGVLLRGCLQVIFSSVFVRISGQDGCPQVKKVQIGRIFLYSIHSYPRWQSSKWGQMDQCTKPYFSWTVENVNIIVYGKWFGSVVPIADNRISLFLCIQRPWKPLDDAYLYFFGSGL